MIASDEGPTEARKKIKRTLRKSILYYTIIYSLTHSGVISRAARPPEPDVGMATAQSELDGILK